MVDYLEALKRPFSDMKKLLIGIFLGSIPIVNLIVVDYTLVCTSLTKIKVEKDNLPEWENYGDLFKKGLIAAIIGFILFIPNSLVLFGAFETVVTSPTVNQMLGGISPDTWNKIFTGEITEMQIQDWFAQNWTQFVPLLVSATPFIILGIILGLIASYILPVIVLEWLKEDSFTAAFRWEVVKKTLSMDYLVNWIVVGIFGMIMSALFSRVPLLGTGIVVFVSGVFSYTIFSEIYEEL